MNCILSSRVTDTIPKERHVALQVHFARCFFAKVLLPVPGMYEMKELKDSPDNRTLFQLASEYLQEFHNSLTTSILHT